jgi:hypothetical protein
LYDGFGTGHRQFLNFIEGLLIIKVSGFCSAVLGLPIICVYF